MKVYIGPYKEYLSTYVLFGKLEERSWISEKTFDRIDKIVDPPIRWWNKRPWNKRKIKVRIDDYDAWNGDHTLSYIIVPLLEKIKEAKHGAPYIKDEDVPEHLRSSAAKSLTKEEIDVGEVDEFHFKRYEWILDEMIWAFKEIRDENPGEEIFYKERGEFEFEETPETKNETDEEKKLYEMKWTKKPKIDRKGLLAYHERIENGIRLFGVYYTTLWT